MEDAVAGFLSALVHDLRTPLTVVGGYADLLLNEDGIDAKLAAFEILRAAGELGAIADTLLLTARLESGDIEAAMGTLNLLDAVEQAVSRAAEQIARHGARVSVSSATAAPEARADTEGLGVVLDAIIDNAIRFGGDAPAVDVAVGNAWIRVSDSGTGVPEELRPHIFERFVRSPAPGSHRGLGLGLYIARGLAGLQDATVELEKSETGKGSTFLVTLSRPEAA